MKLTYFFVNSILRSKTSNTFKSGGWGWGWNMLESQDDRNAHRIFVGQLNGRHHLGDLAVRYTKGGDIKTNLKRNRMC